MTTMPPRETPAPPAPAPAKPATEKPTSAPRSSAWNVVLGILGLIAILALAYAIYQGVHSRTQAETQLTQATKTSAIPTVNVTHPKSGAVASEVSLPGNTQAFTDTPIYARASGYLKSWSVDIGARVKQGQQLAEIETPELDEQLQQAQADLKNAQANLQISQITSERYQTLLKSNSVSQQEAQQTASDLDSKKALVAASEANVRRLQQTKDFQKVIAPFDGVITARHTDIGALIQSGDTSTPRELFHLAAIDRLRVYIPVPEIYAATVKTGLKVTLTLDSFPGQIFNGTVVRDSDSIDPTTRTLNVEVDVDNPDDRLMPGAYAFVHLPVPGSATSVTIPANTLLFRSEGLRVGVVRDGKVALVPITIGHDYGDSVEVLSGLTTKDEVILDPADSLAEGASVEVAPPAEKPAQP